MQDGLCSFLNELYKALKYNTVGGDSCLSAEVDAQARTALVEFRTGCPSPPLPRSLPPALLLPLSPSAFFCNFGPGCACLGLVVTLRRMRAWGRGRRQGLHSTRRQRSKVYTLRGRGRRRGLLFTRALVRREGHGLLTRMFVACRHWASGYVFWLQSRRRRWPKQPCQVSSMVPPNSKSRLPRVMPS